MAPSSAWPAASGRARDSSSHGSALGPASPEEPLRKMVSACRPRKAVSSLERAPPTSLTRWLGRGGVWFCTTCGAYAKACRDHKSTCHLLSDQCHGQPSGSGAKVLKRLAKGETPRHGMAWPLPELDEARSAAATLEELWPDKRGAKRSNKRTRKSPQMGHLAGKRANLLTKGDVIMPEHAVHDELLQEYELNEDEDPWGEQERWEGAGSG